MLTAPSDSVFGNQTQRKEQHSSCIGRGYLQDIGIAAATFVAVEEVLTPADSADATLVAVELQLGDFVIEELTDHTGESPKGDATFLAGSTDWLSQVTQCADHFQDSLAVKFMSFLRVLQYQYPGSSDTQVYLAYERKQGCQ